MKNFIRKIWDAFVRLLSKVEYDKWLHFIFGLLIAAFCYITLHIGFWSALPTLVFAFAKEAFDKWTTGKWEWWDIVATCAGGIVIEIFAALALVLK